MSEDSTTDPELDALMATELAKEPSAHAGETALDYDDDLLLTEVLANEVAQVGSSQLLSAHVAPPHPPAAASQPTTTVKGESPSTVTDKDDDELLMNELVALATTPAPFVSHAGNKERTAPKQAEEADAGESGSGQRPHVSQSKPSVSSGLSSSPRATLSPASRRTPTLSPSPGVRPQHGSICLNEEEVILDAILGSIECQQSTVSGDLTEGASARGGGGGGAGPAPTRARLGSGDASPPGDAVADGEDGCAEQERIDRVLAHAEAIASSSPLGREGHPSRRGDCVLSFHEHTALRRALQPSRSSLGRPTCAALRPTPHSPIAASSADKQKSTSSKQRQASRTEALYLALGTSLGGVMLFGEHWALLGVCGSTDASVVAQRGGVVSLSIPSVPSHTYLTIASGYEKGPFVLWSVETLAPLRVLQDEFASPVLVVRHLFCDGFRTLCLEAAGGMKLLTYTRVLSRTLVRSSTVAQGGHHQASVTAARGPVVVAPIADFDVIPHPSPAYLAKLRHPVVDADRSGATPVLFYAPPAQAPTASPPELAQEVDLSASPFVVPGRHLIASVSSDTLVLQVLETGLANVTAAVARHTHPPSSSLSNELVRFVLVEGESPRVMICVSWNTAVELVRVVFDADGNAVSMESIAITAMFCPIHALCAVGSGSSVILLDRNSTVLLFDAAVAVLVEQHTMKTLDPVGFTHRLSGAKYHGALTGNGRAAFFLGRERLVTCALLPWNERLNALLVRRRYTEALDLAQDLAEEVALCAVGLSTEASQRRRALKRYMEAICVAYLRDTFAAMQTGKARSFVLHTVLERILRFCSRVDALEEVFFGSVMACLRDAKETAAAFVALERAMLSGVVTSMPEMYVQSFFHFFTTNPRVVAAEDERQMLALREASSSSSGLETADGTYGGSSPTSAAVAPPVAVQQQAYTGAQRAEKALMHLDTNVDCLETLAQENHLTRLAITVLSLRRGQYGDALRVALRGATHTADAGQETPVDGPGIARDCRIALEYMECTMHGVSLLPSTKLPSNTLVEAKRQVWRYAVMDTNVFRHLITHARPTSRFLDILLLALGDTDTAFSPWSEDHLTLSLPYNMAWVFRLLVHAGNNSPSPTPEEEEGDSEPPLLFNDERAAVNFKPWDIARQRAQRQMDVREPSPPSYEDSVHYYLNGLVELMCSRHGSFLRHAVRSPEACNGLARVMVLHFTYMFQVAETATERHNMQTQLTRFMKATLTYGPDGVSFGTYTKGFAQTGMARCLAAVYCSEADYGRAIDCYLDRENNRAEPKLGQSVFALLRSEVLRLEQGNSTKPGRSTKAALRELRRAVMERVGALVQVDATALAQFVFDFLPSNNDDVMRVLKGSSRTFLLYLDELLGKGDVAVASDVNLQNTYLELLCAHEPERVYPYLKEHDSRITYDVQVALKAVRKHRIADAAVFLLEKTLMVDDAMAVLVAAVQSALVQLRAQQLQAVVAAAAQGEEEAAGAGALPELARAKKTVEHLLMVGIDFLCAYQKRTAKAAEGHWFRLLNTLATPRRVLVAWLAELKVVAAQVEEEQQQGGDNDQPATDEMVSFWRQQADELAESAQMQAQGRHPASSFSTSQNPDGGAQPVPLPTLPTAQLSRACVPFATSMIAVYSAYTSLLLHTMVRTLDLSTVVSKIVQDNADETFGPFKPIIVDIMGAISFDLEVKRLCQVCVEEDLVDLGSNLYRHLNSGIVPLSDSCYLCGRGLRDKPPPIGALAKAAAAHAAHGSGLVHHHPDDDDDSLGTGTALTQSAVCVFVCGHGYHEACRAAAAAVDDRHECIECYLENAGAVRKAKYAFIAEVAAAPVVAEAETVATLDPATREKKQALLTRRLRHTRAKVDQAGGEYYEVLRSLVALSAADDLGGGGGTPKAPAKWRQQHNLGHGGQGQARLLRAPAPQLPVSLGEIGSPSGSVLDLTSEDGSTTVHKLTDAEILELFGDG